MLILPEFYTDKDIARILRMSPEWVRGQRHKRRNGLPCTLQLEPRYIGSCARYLREDVDAFVAALKAQG
ncbi:helix-turn-helix domain-containing protein [Sphingorhabdus sp.]|uniref:helix-turn-helix domain-containing protein n=1 Tax=Sphingorhabdus sp. TaxID=1902408 RepID=UPI00398392E7